ncbi:aspartyl beta-hydroxylase [Acidaminobacter sp. JC074]|uniref:phasin family protein n=1 Tax=Acidaminobacter sp. JC074 TaxID=2530199 RepID=UPI001F0D9F21|nr:hypothetical protein [Acidaminobacter sp. JC074]MCH4887785.1 aspartyl beta-hydroxylase [Acidaminobacter sp. JC074]
MANVFGEELRKVVLAGIGATALTVEKSSKLIDDLVEKGELTVELGKSMNEELKHNMKRTFNQESNLISLDELDQLDQNQLETLKEKLAALEVETKKSSKDEKK